MSARKWTWISSNKTVRFAFLHHNLFGCIHHLTSHPHDKPFCWVCVMHTQVERVIAERVIKDSSGDVVPEYLVKWQGLSYAEATW